MHGCTYGMKSNTARREREREKDRCDCCVRNPKQGENKGNERAEEEECFRFLRGTMHLYRRRGGGYRRPDLNGAETAPSQTLFRSIDFEPLSLTGVKPDNVTSHWSRFGARNSRIQIHTFVR